MGLAIDTVGLTVTAGTAATSAFLAMSAATGDSLTVRSFPQTATAMLEEVMYDASTVNAFRVRSPLLHDNVQGIRFKPAATPARYALPQYLAQRLYAQDTLIAEVDDQTANAVYTAGLRIYYSDLPGASARLANPGDIQGNFVYVKPVEVSISSPTAKAWTDTAITATENLLHANTDYAVLGFMCDSQTDLIGVKGIETGNLRICASGASEQYGTAQVFMDLSVLHGTPHIPVFNSANAGNFYVSVFPRANTTLIVTLILAQLAQPFSG